MLDFVFFFVTFSHLLSEQLSDLLSDSDLMLWSPATKYLVTCSFQVMHDATCKWCNIQVLTRPMFSAAAPEQGQRAETKRNSLGIPVADHQVLLGAPGRGYCRAALPAIFGGTVSFSPGAHPPEGSGWGEPNSWLKVCCHCVPLSTKSLGCWTKL